MSEKREYELLLRSYLLGDLNSDDQQRIEQYLMMDAAALDEMGCLENDLIDDYLEGALSGNEKKRFEDIFLAAPERMRMLRFAQVLKRYIARQKTKQKSRSLWKKFLPPAEYSGNPGLKWSLAACLLVLLAGGSLAALQIARLQKALDQAMSANPPGQLVELQKRNNELASALHREQIRVNQLQQSAAELKSQEPQMQAKNQTGRLQSAVISIALAPGLLRDMDGIHKIRIPEQTNLVQFDLKMESQNHHRYQAILRRVGEDPLWTQISPRMQSGTEPQYFRFIMPAHLLKPGDFVLKLSGIPHSGDFEDIGSYHFRIIGE
jgi:hypothetical protein